VYAEKLGMRLFTGIDLPADVGERLKRLLVLLRPKAQLKWSPIDNLHITTKFIGECPEGQLDSLKSALGSLGRRSPIPIVVEGLGWFPNPHQPRVFWVGVQGGQALSDLARGIQQALEPLGIAPESKPYAPHITLARVAQPVPLSAVQQAVASLESVEFGTFQAACFFLYRSHSGPAGSVYTKLSEFRFSA